MLITVLPLAGTLPFIGAVVCMAMGIDAVPPGFRIDVMLTVYALVITGFMAGAHWGQAVGLQAKTPGRGLPTALLWLSNGMALAIISAAIVLSMHLLWLALAMYFSLLLLIDLGLYRRGAIQLAYWRMRQLVTAVVVACLFAASAMRHIS
ncbi:MAG: DUF3429 family protein [Paraperlucidibaca sp.]